jgi:hypothetical protein
MQKALVQSDASERIQHYDTNGTSIKPYSCENTCHYTYFATLHLGIVVATLIVVVLGEKYNE